MEALLFLPGLLLLAVPLIAIIALIGLGVVLLGIDWLYQRLLFPQAIAAT